MELAKLIQDIEVYLKKNLTIRDPAHDYEHIMRVFKNATIIGKAEGADLGILLPATLLHDLVVYPKRSSKSSKSSDESADMAEMILSKYGLNRESIEKISYAIRTHSFSKQLKPLTIEAKVLQDADRLDALGAIGIARTFSVGGFEGRALYNPEDPFNKSHRILDDRQWTIDHFFKKLLKLQSMMHTQTSKKMAQKRINFMQNFIEELKFELAEST